MVGRVEGGFRLVRPRVAARELGAVVAGDVEEPLPSWLPSRLDRRVNRCQPA